MPQIIRRAIGARLREARLKAGLTQEQVALDFQCSRQAVSSWERGATMPTVLELRELATLYVVTSDQLLFGVENITKERQDILAEMRLGRQNPPETVNTHA